MKYIAYGSNMVQEQMAFRCPGLIDVIYVKSVSRFSRNAADALAVLKRLKEIGIRVLFEKEGLDSSDPSTEIVIVSNLYDTVKDILIPAFIQYYIVFFASFYTLSPNLKSV